MYLNFLRRGVAAIAMTGLSPALLAAAPAA